MTVTADYYNQVAEANSTSGTARVENTATVMATSVAAPYPDLQVQNLSVSPAAITSGSTIQVSWDDANTGNAPVDAAFVDSLTIVNTTTGATLLSTTVSYDPTQAGTAPIAAGGSQQQTYSLTLPQGNPGAGNLTVTVTTDAEHQIFEYNSSGTGETNNTSSVTVTSALASYPDLVTSGVTAAGYRRPGPGDLCRLDVEELRIGRRLRAVDRASPAGNRCGRGRPDPARGSDLHRLARRRAVGSPFGERAHAQPARRQLLDRGQREPARRALRAQHRQ